MTRSLYRVLLLLHPGEFRRHFAGEMLWIFDQTAMDGGALPLFGDAFLSLARQWIVRQGTWKVAVATVGGFLYISLAMSALTQMPVRAGTAALHLENPAGDTDDEESEANLRDASAGPGR